MANNRALQQFVKFIEREGLACLKHEDGTIRGLRVSPSSRWHWQASVEGNDRFLVFRAYCCVNVPESRRGRAMEYLNRANWGLCFGNFELDLADGEVCFRASVPISENGVSMRWISQLIVASDCMMHRYLQGLLAVVFGEIAPQRAIELAEQGKDVLEPPEDDLDERFEAMMQELSERIESLSTDDEDGDQANGVRQIDPSAN